MKKVVVSKMSKKVKVNDKMQKGYQYILTELVGPKTLSGQKIKNFHPDFKPELTPKQMLVLGVFGGRYMRDCKKEFPADWFTKAKFHPDKKSGHSSELNFFGVDASQPLSVWREKGWIHKDDPRGWFQWYCRYYMGRRHEDDERQIKRWKAFRRHWSAVRKNCPSTMLGTSKKRDLNCRLKQRQALLHWAYDSRKI